MKLFYIDSHKQVPKKTYNNKGQNYKKKIPIHTPMKNNIQQFITTKTRNSKK